MVVWLFKLIIQPCDHLDSSEDLPHFYYSFWSYTQIKSTQQMV